MNNKITAGFVLALLLILSYNAHAAVQSNFYGVWVRGSTYYEINKSTLTKTYIDNDTKKNKYRIVKWEKSGDNAYTIYTLSEGNKKVSFEVEMDAYSDVSIDGNEMKKSSAAELNKAIRSAEAAVAAEKKAKEQAPKAAAANAEILASLQGTFSDSRDGKNYNTVKIGSQTWMAENLNYEADFSECYNNEPSNCNTYGRLYSWSTAKEVCPSGWHLPTSAEWDKLYRYIDGISGTKVPYRSEMAGKYLKAKNGWEDNGNGTDSYGFAALPGGRGYLGGSFGYVGLYGYWWSASGSNAYNRAYNRVMDYYNEYASWSGEDINYLFSVRCVQN